MIGRGREDKLSITRQCEIFDLNRSGIYYKPVPLSEIMGMPKAAVLPVPV